MTFKHENKISFNMKLNYLSNLHALDYKTVYCYDLSFDIVKNRTKSKQKHIYLEQTTDHKIIKDFKPSPVWVADNQ